MSRKTYVLIAGTLLGVLVLALGAAPAFATSGIGEKIGDEVESWAAALLFGVAVFAGLPAIGKHQVGAIAMVMLGVAGLTMLLFAQSEFKSAVDALAGAFT